MSWFTKSTLASDVEVVQLLRQLHVKLAGCEAEIEKLKSAQLSLRGFVYSQVRKHVQQPPEDESSVAPAAESVGGSGSKGPLSRDELRRWLTASGRFTPGRPAKHD